MKNKSLLGNTSLSFPELWLPRTLFHQRIKFIIAYQTGCYQILIVDKNYKFMGLPAVPRSLKNSFIILSTLYNMVYILIYKTSLTIEDSFCVQERVRIFIASQLKNLISKVSKIGMQSCTYIGTCTLVTKCLGPNYSVVFSGC